MKDKLPSLATSRKEESNSLVTFPAGSVEVVPPVKVPSSEKDPVIVFTLSREIFIASLTIKSFEPLVFSQPLISAREDFGLMILSKPFRV